MRPAALGLLLLVGSAPALTAQDARRDTTAVELPTLEVTVPRAKARATDQPGVTVPAEAVQRAPAANSYDLIRRTAGLEVHEQGQGPGWASDVVIRGFTSDHSSDVLLTIDGVPVNLPIHGHVEGYADWSLLSVPSVKSIEVIPGPTSPRYGNFAFGGVVAVETAADAGETRFGTSGSSNGDGGAWLRTGARGDTRGGLVALEARRDDGWRRNSDGWLGNAFLRGWTLAGLTRLEGTLALYGSTWDSPGFVSVADYNAGRLTRAQDPTDGGDARRAVARVGLKRPLGERWLLDAFAWGQLGRSTVFLNVPEDGLVEQQEERDRRTALGLTTMLRSTRPSGEWSLGASARTDRGRYDLYATDQRDRTDTTQATDGRYREGALWLGWSSPARPFQVELAVRGDLLRFATRDRLAGQASFATHTTGIVSPKVRLRQRFSDRLALSVSASRGFRSAVGAIANPDRPLVSEWSGDLGLGYAGRRLQGRLTAFQVEVRNERIQNPVTLVVSDAGRSRRRGLSLDVAAEPVPDVHFMGEVTYNDAKITGSSSGGAPLVPVRAEAVCPCPRAEHDEPLTPGARVPGVARYFGRVGGDAHLTRRLGLRLQGRFSGPVVPIGEPDTETQAFALLDAGVSLHLPSLGGTVDLDLLNALDTKYPELRAGGFINPGAPRTLRFAFRTGS
ncbi:MAG: TonB-dependent receptor plug domain-containing protein [Gemmatimonadetes bacterium]|nr:TonB-dependent receptor plug domain-containing protein [Gemmatimonadota bacterium]